MITSLDKNTALVLIDLQNGIVNMPVIGSVQSLLKNAASLMDAFREAGLPIVIVTVDLANFSRPQRTDNDKTSMEVDPSWMKLAPGIVAKDGDIRIVKTNWSAFVNPDMDKELKNRGVTGIVLAGISTSIGVEGTARSAAEKGYSLSFALDAMTDTSAEAQNHSIGHIFPRIGETGTTAEIIEKLRTRA